MQKGSLYRRMSGVLVLLVVLAGCQGGGSGGSSGAGSTSSRGAGPAAGTARVYIQVGDNTPAQSSTSTSPTGVTRQRVGGIPPEVVTLTLRVTASGKDINRSPFTIPLDTGALSVEITANVSHLFALDAKDQQGDSIFHGEASVTLGPGAETDLPIALVAREITRLVAQQSVSAVAGGVVEVANPQSTVKGLRLTVPARALAQDATFVVMEITNPTNVPVLPSQAGGIVDLNILPSSTTFAVPVSLVFPYNSTLVRDLGFSEANLRVWRFNTVAGQWAPVPTQTVDTVNHLITAQLTSLSLYTVSGPPAPSSVNRPPVADAQFVTTAEDTAHSVVLTGSDPDGDPLTFRVVNAPTRGTLSGTPPTVTYVPNANTNGRDTFTFVVNDGRQDSVPATVTVDVTAVNDAPVVLTPVANVRVDDSTSNTTTVLDLASVFGDVDIASNADTLTLSVFNNTNPSLVATTLVGTTLTLTYQSRQHGSAVITVRATDQGGLFTDTSFTVTVDRTFPFVLGLSPLGDASQRLSGPAH